jgi:hypothetical protein
MRHHFSSPFNLPFITANPFEDLEEPNMPCSLKQLSHNLSLLEQQQHLKMMAENKYKSEERSKHSSVPIRKIHQK